VTLLRTSKSCVRRAIYGSPIALCDGRRLTSVWSRRHGPPSYILLRQSAAAPLL